MQSTKSAEDTSRESRTVAGRAPMLAQGGPSSTRFTHTSGGGFCTVCGTVWPCAQAAKNRNDDPR